MKSKYLFSVFAIAIAVTLCAFTAPRKSDQLLTSFPVWFQVYNNGQPIDPSNGLTNPASFGCANTSSDLCARALTYDTDPDETEVILNEDETTYSIAEGVDITSSAVHDGTLTKDTP